MKSYTPPQSWDAGKFAARYRLDFNKDFYVDEAGKLVVFPVLPDDPPSFEPPDPPPPTITSQIEALALTPTLEPLRAILKRLAGGK